MNIIEKSIDELIPYENNPRLNENAIDYVAKSIEDFGFKVPLVIDINNVIVAGHTRYLASRKLGIDKIPCLVADDLNTEQIKAFRLVDNKVAEYSEWDMDKLHEELNDIKMDMSKFELFSFDEIDINEEDFLLDEDRKEKEKEIKVCPHCGKEINI